MAHGSFAPGIQEAGYQSAGSEDAEVSSLEGDIAPKIVKARLQYGLGGKYMDFDICDDMSNREYKTVGWIQAKAAKLLETEAKKIQVVVHDRPLPPEAAYESLYAFVREGAGCSGGCLEPSILFTAVVRGGA